MDGKLIISNNDSVVANLLKRETERQYEIQKKRNEKKLINPEHEQYNYFTQIFQEKVKEIETWLEQINTLEQNELSFQFDKIWKELHNLQKFVGDSLLFLREYDIKICQKNLQDIEIKTRKLEEKMVPKKKFGFKHKNKKTSNQIQIQGVSKDVVDNTAFKKNITNLMDNNFFGFKNEKNQNLILTGGCLSKKDISLQNLEKCLVKLDGTASTLHMSNLQNCVVLSGPIETSIFIENCKNCKFAIACQQLRLHSSINCDIYLHVTSKAIIEDSKNINVAEYNYEYKNLDDDFIRSNLDKSTNNWDKIDDFNWLVLDKKSPNWNILKNPSNFDWRNFQIN